MGVPSVNIGDFYFERSIEEVVKFDTGIGIDTVIVHSDLQVGHFTSFGRSVDKVEC